MSINEQFLPCFGLCEPESGRPVFLSPAARRLWWGEGSPQYTWEFIRHEKVAEAYKKMQLIPGEYAVLRLSDRPHKETTLLFSTLVEQEGRQLRQDVLIDLGAGSEEGLNTAALMLNHYAAALKRREDPPPASGEVRITTLGGLEIETCLGRMSAGDIASRQVCLFLIYLLMSRGRVAPAQEIAEALWPGELLESPYNMVKNVAFRLRRQLAPISEKPLITAYHGTYVLNPELTVLVDCDFFDALIRQYYRGPQDDPQSLAQAISLYRGTLLPGFDSELWLIARTQYYKNAYRRAVLDYGGFLLRQGDYLPLYGLLRDALAIYPQDAGLHVAMIQAQAQEKGPAAARQYLQKALPLLSPAQQRLLNRQLDQLAQKTDAKNADAEKADAEKADGEE